MPCAGIDFDGRPCFVEHVAQRDHLFLDASRPVMRFVRHIKQEAILPAFFAQMRHHEPQRLLADAFVFRRKCSSVNVFVRPIARIRLDTKEVGGRPSPTEMFAEDWQIRQRNVPFVKPTRRQFVEFREIRRHFAVNQFELRPCGNFVKTQHVFPQEDGQIDWLVVFMVRTFPEAVVENGRRQRLVFQRKRPDRNAIRLLHDDIPTIRKRQHPPVNACVMTPFRLESQIDADRLVRLHPDIHADRWNERIRIQFRQAVGRNAQSIYRYLREAVVTALRIDFHVADDADSRTRQRLSVSLARQI